MLIGILLLDFLKSTCDEDLIIEENKAIFSVRSFREDILAGRFELWSSNCYIQSVLSCDFPLACKHFPDRIHSLGVCRTRHGD